MISNKWKLDNITDLHIELSSICNSICPGCPRYVSGSPHLDIEPAEITFEQFKAWFPEHFLKNIKNIDFCGNFGDPMAASDAEHILEYCSEVGVPLLSVRTNGGLKTPTFWKKIGKIFSKNPSWAMVFSIDGLEDTNHLYRRNVSWNKLKNNVEAYTSEGGYSKWEYLIFKHNEHQIRQASLLANKWKINEFYAKGALGLDDGINLKAMPAQNINGDVEYWLLPPTNNYNRSFKTNDETIIYPDISDLKGQVEKLSKEFTYGNVRNIAFDVQEDERIKNSKIKCRVIKLGMQRTQSEYTITKRIGIFIDSHGMLFPCCWTGLYYRKKLKEYINKIQLSMSDYQFFSKIFTFGIENINLHNKSIEDIINSGYLNEIYADSWNRSSLETGKLGFCSKTCGKINDSLDNLYLRRL